MEWKGLKIRPSRLPVLVAWLAIVVVVGAILSNSRLMAPQVSRLVGRHLLGIEAGGLLVRDWDIHIFEGVELYGVSLTLPDRSGGMALASADTVSVDFRLNELWEPAPHLRRVIIRRPEVFVRSGAADTSSAATPEDEPLPLPRLVVDMLEIHEAYLEFSAPDGRLTEKISRLDWRGGVRSGDQLGLVLNSCSVYWDSHNSVLEHLRGQVTVDRELLRATPVYGLVNGKPVHVSGFRRWDGGLDISVEGEGVSVAEVEDLIDMNIGFAAQGDMTGRFHSAGDTIFYQGRFSGVLEGYDVQDLTAGAVIAPREVLLQDMSGVLNGATFTGSGVFDISNPDSVSFVLEGQARDVDLAKGLIPDEEDLPATDGAGRLRIEHTDKPLWTRVQGQLTQGFIDIIPFDTCVVDVQAYADRVVFDRVDLNYRDLSAHLKGEADTLKVFRGKVRARSTDLSTLPAGWGWPPLQGALRGQGDLAGPLDALDFTGAAVFDSLALGPLDAAAGVARLDIAGVLGEPVISGRIEGHGLEVGKVPFGDFQLEGGASSRAARVDWFYAGHGDTGVSFTLKADFQDSVSHFNLGSYALDLEGTSWSIDEPTDFTVGPGYFHLPGMRLESEQGAMAMDLLFHRQQAVDGHLELVNFDLGLLEPFVNNTQPLQGELTAEVVVGGMPEDPVVDLEGLLTGSDFTLARVDTLAVEASFNQGVLSFRDLDLVSEFGRVKGRGMVAHPGAGPRDFWPGAELDMDLEVKQGDWEFLEQFQLPALDRLAGLFDGRMQVAGTTDSPQVVGELTSAPFHVHWLHLDKLTGTVWADRDALVLADLEGHKEDLRMTGRIEVPLVMDFLSEPVTPLQAPFYMQLEIPEGSNLEPLTRATNAFVQSSGRGSAYVLVSGPLDHPFYQGRLKIRDAGFVLRDLEEIYHDVSCEGSFQGDTLWVRNIVGREGLRGTLRGEGEVVFRGLELSSFDIRLQTERFLLASIPDLRAVVNSNNARISSAFVGPDSLLVPKFTGNFEVVKGRYTGDFKEKKGAVDPMAATVAPDWLAEMSLHGAPRTARILNREMDLYLGGDLDLVRDEAGMFMRGQMDVNSGRLIVFNNSFKVERGRLDLSRELGFDPQIDLDATTSYRMQSQVSSNSIIENIGVHVGGTVLSPQITFSSDRGYSREAIQRMLLGLDPFQSATGDRERLANTSISAGFNVLEREIAREIEIFDTFEIDQIQRQRETGAELDPLIGVGKYIGNDVYLKFAQGVRQDDRDILVEYQINDHLLLQSEIRRRIDENQGNETYNLDLKYRFEY